MKASIHVFAVTVLLTVIFFSCSKKSDDPQPQTSSTTSSRIDILIAHNWNVTGLTVDPPYSSPFGPITDVYDYAVPACQQDNIYQFKKDSSYVVSDGANVCSPSDAETGKWYFNKDQTIITTISKGETTTYTILEISANKFVGKSSAPVNYEGKSYIATLTFTTAK